jgi:hypothetical protein
MFLAPPLICWQKLNLITVSLHSTLLYFISLISDKISHTWFAGSSEDACWFLCVIKFIWLLHQFIIFKLSTVATMTWLTVMEYRCHGYVPLVVSTPRSFPNSWLITGFITRLTRRVPLVEHGLLTLPEHLSSPPVFSGVRVTRSLILCVCFVDRC